MKHLVKGLLVAVILAGLGLWAWLKYSAPLNKGTSAPESTKILDKMEAEGALDFVVSDISGRAFSLKELSGKVIIVNFWASWCDPCVQEFPSMLELVERFKGRVVIVAVSADYEMDELKKFLKIFKGWNPEYMKVMWDKDKAIASLYKVEALPESFVIGRDFRLVRKVSGSENWTTPAAIEFFESLLAKPSSK